MTQPRDPPEHECEGRCICPLDGNTLEWSPHYLIHRCPDKTCKNKIGLTVVQQPEKEET